ncbi:hypothetical protein ACQ4M3_01380 [Leptolyngbya sp. AN03gr2]|uniref:hypothetical protein n=1 Tax=unclassified Leptolyngbya TaxID=2650499 RepID=UPI003D321F7A
MNNCSLPAYDATDQALVLHQVSLIRTLSIRFDGVEVYRIVDGVVEDERKLNPTYQPYNITIQTDARDEPIVFVWDATQNISVNSLSHVAIAGF